MPATNQMYPMNEPDEIDHLSENERRDRGAAIEKLWKYYKGDHRKPLKVKVGQADDNVILNLSKILVNRNIAALFGSGITFSTDDTPERNEQEDFIDSVWNGGELTKAMAKKQILMNDLAQNGFVTGTAAMRLALIDGDVRLINVDPGSVVAFWNEEDIEQILWYSVYWSKMTRQDIVLFENESGGQSWEIFDYRRKDDRGKWMLENEEAWPFEWSPLKLWKNLPRPNEVYGESDLDHAALNDVINFTVSNVNRILQKHGHPKTIGLGFDAGDVVMDEIGGLLTVDKPPNEASVFHLEMESDLAASMRFYEELRMIFFALGANVDLRTLRDKLGDLTNFALQLLFKEMVDRITLKRAFYGEAISEINSHILELGGMGENVEVSITWPPPLPSNVLETLEVAERERALGIISKETVAKQLDVDFEMEQELIDAEAANADLGTLIQRGLQNNRQFNRGF